MSTTTFIRKFVFSLPKDQIFTTRECLIYGQRAAVDYALYTLVKKEIIIRLARGVFVRNDGITPEFSPLTIAALKARAFGKRIITHASQIATKLGISNESDQEETFAVDGPTSSFWFGKIRIHLKHIGLRQMKLGESKAGQAARVLWHLGQENFSRDLARKVTTFFLRPDREEFRRAAVYMPGWLSSHFMYHVRWLPAILIET